MAALNAVLLFAINFSFCSCATEKPIYGFSITPKELEAVDVLGIVETEFDATRYYDEKALLEKGYDELLIVAKKKYAGNIAIKNIFLEKRSSNKNLSYILLQIYTSHYITVRARGFVIKIEEDIGNKI